MRFLEDPVQRQQLVDAIDATLAQFAAGMEKIAEQVRHWPAADGAVSVVRAVPYRGHYVTSRGWTVFQCERLDPDAVSAGDTVAIGEVQVPVRAVERDGLGRIVGIVKGEN